MEGLLVLGILAGALAVFDLLALRYGADSRPGLGSDGPVTEITV